MAVRQDTRSRWRAAWGEVAPTLAITRREIVDLLRDWRLMAPIGSFVVTLPFLANAIAFIGYAFVAGYDAIILIERIYPVIMAGMIFLCITTSLMIALETFVGEKERQSLEPLLMTPLSDLQLYLGKLLVGIAPSIFTSLFSMVLYLLLLGLWSGWWPPLALWVPCVLLAITKATAIVAGSQIISSQASSIRNAGLQASFVIIPLVFGLGIEVSAIFFVNYAVLWWMIAFFTVVSILLVRLGVRIFSREHLLSQVINEIDLGMLWRTFWEAAWPHRGIRALYFEEIPALLRACLPELLITVLVVFGGGALVGGWAGQMMPLPAVEVGWDAVDPATVQALLSEMDEDASLDDFVADMDPGSLQEAAGSVLQRSLYSTLQEWFGAVPARGIFLHNVRSLANSAAVSAFSLGIGGVLLLLLPMAIIAYLATQFSAVMGGSPWTLLLVAVLPHGILELPAAVLATAQGMHIGDAILVAPKDGGGLVGVVREVGHFVKLFVALIVPLLLIAAWIEAEITLRLTFEVLFGS